MRNVLSDSKGAVDSICSAFSVYGGYMAIECLQKDEILIDNSENRGRLYL